MFLKSLTDRFFEPPSPHPLPPFDAARTVLNYLWVQGQDLPSWEKVPEPERPLCKVPLHSFDRAYENARRYADVPVMIWVDFKLLDDESRFWVQTHHYFNAPKNVQLKDISDIPDYDSKVSSWGRLWQIIDLAKPYVLQHCLSTMPDVEDVFFADFDIKDVSLGHKHVQKRLARYGVVAGGVKWGPIENSYMAFRRSRAAEDKLKDMIEATSGHYGCNEADGYLAFHMCLRKWGNEGGFTKGDPVVHVTEKCGYELPENLLYKELGLCVSAHTLG